MVVTEVAASRVNKAFPKREVPFSAFIDGTTVGYVDVTASEQGSR